MNTNPPKYEVLPPVRIGDKQGAHAVWFRDITPLNSVNEATASHFPGSYDYMNSGTVPLLQVFEPRDVILLYFTWTIQADSRVPLLHQARMKPLSHAFNYALGLCMQVPPVRMPRPFDGKDVVALEDPLCDLKNQWHEAAYPVVFCTPRGWSLGLPSFDGLFRTRCAFICEQM